MISLSSCKVGRFFIFNFADIKDHKKFPDRDLTASKATFEFLTPTAPLVPKGLTANGTQYTFSEFLENFTPLLL